MTVSSDPRLKELAGAGRVFPERGGRKAGAGFLASSVVRISCHPNSSIVSHLQNCSKYQQLLRTTLRTPDGNNQVFIVLQLPVILG